MLRPPASLLAATLLPAWLCALAGPPEEAAAGRDAPPVDSGVVEEVRVERVVIPVRVTDRLVRPLMGLGRENFRVRIGGRDAEVEAVEWVRGAQPRLEALAAQYPDWPEFDPRLTGRLLVFFFQRHTLPSRAVGTMRMLQEAREFVRTLPPEDYVAVLSFDSRLRLYTDFTRDRGRVEDILARRILPYRPPPPAESAAFPSLFEHMDRDAVRRAATPEQCLLLMARALGEVPGSKSLLFFGYGMGRLAGGVVQMRPEYEAARAALLDARVTVFSLDVTRADYHTLEGPLRVVAEDTGGFYIRGYDSFKVAMRRVGRAVEGAYLLFVVKPDLAPGYHPIRIRLEGVKGKLYYPEQHLEKPSS